MLDGDGDRSRLGGQLVTDHPSTQPGVERRMHVSTELVLQPGALDAARIITELGAVTLRFTPSDFGPYVGTTDVIFVAMTGNVADELRRLADRIHTPAAPSLRVVIDRHADVPELTEEQAEAAAKFVRGVVEEYVWCADCAALVPNAIAQAHAVRNHPTGVHLDRARFYGWEPNDE